MSRSKPAQASPTVNWKTGRRKRQARLLLRPIPDKRRGLNLSAALTVLASLLVGVAIGVLVMHNRHASAKIVATVDGVTITSDDFYHRLEQEAGAQTLRKMVNEELTLHFAHRRGAEPTEAAVNARLQALRQSPAFERQLKERHQTVEDVKRGLRVEMAKEALFGSGVTASEAEARAFYKQQTDPRNPHARFYTPPTTTVSIIVTKTEAECRKAEAALVPGADFAAVARTFSQDQSRENGGLLPPIAQGRSQCSKIPGMEQAIFALSPGQRLGPRLFANAWWIIRCEAKTPAVTQPYAAVQEPCRLGAQLQKGVPANAASLSQDFKAFQRQAPIQLFWDRYYWDVFK